jgi:hypothetical protein
VPNESFEGKKHSMCSCDAVKETGGEKRKKKKKETHESDAHCTRHKLVGSSAVYLLWVAAARASLY